MPVALACGLQIADSTTDLFVPGVAGGLPERPRILIVEGDQSRHSTYTATAQVLLTGSRQREPDALPPMPFANSEPVHVPSPAIPAGNQRTDDLVAALSDQQGSRGIPDQTLDVLQAIGRGSVPTPLLGPQLQDRWRLLGPTSTYRDSLSSQAGSMARASVSAGESASAFEASQQ